MSIFDNGLNFFGLQIKKAVDQEKQNDSAQLSVGLNDDGSAISVASSVSLGIYLDVDGQIKSEVQAIQKYRDISLYVEVDSAVQDIINEAIPMEDSEPSCKLNTDALDFSDDLTSKFEDEFQTVLNLLYFDKMGADIFRRWYVDGRVYFQIIVDKDNPKEGIKKLIPLDSVKIKKVKEVKKKRTPLGAEAIESIEEYFIYNEAGFVAKNMTGGQAAAGGDTGTLNQGLKISPDAIIYCPSGYVDANTGMTLSYLHKAIRPINQLRMLEDATVIYFIARAPELRAFYIDVGSLPKLKADQYMKEIMNRYRNKIVYEPTTGSIQDNKKYLSMLEDFWLPRREGGKGTEIDILPGAQNVAGYLDSLDWFKEKMYDALNVPKSRFQADNGFSLGRSSEITRDELKFQKFIDRLRMKFAELIIQTLKVQLMLKQICNSVEWEEIKNRIKIEWQRDNYFTEFKEQDLWTSRLQLLQMADNYAQKYVSRNWIMKNIMKMSDEDIKIMDDELDAEKNDPRAMGQIMIGINQADQQQEMAQQQADQQFAMQKDQQKHQQSLDKQTTAAKVTAIKNGTFNNQPETDEDNYQQQQ